MKINNYFKVMTDSPRLKDYGKAHRRIGSGAFGCVYLHKVESKNVAIKKINTNYQNQQDEHEISSSPDYANFDEGLRSLINEAIAYAYLDSPYIIKPSAIALDNIQLGIVMPLAMEDLYDSLNRCRISNVQDKKKIMYQITRGVHDAHQANILNLDLKPENILLFGDGIKIADWGKAQLEYCSHLHAVASEVGSIYYNPPEKLNDIMYYDASFDIWSMGCIFATIAKDKILFTGETPDEMLLQIANQLSIENWWHEYDLILPGLGQLLSKILIYDSSQRCSTFEILQDDFFKEFREGSSIQTIRPLTPLQKLSKRAPNRAPKTNHAGQRTKLLNRLLKFCFDKQIISDAFFLTVTMYDLCRYNKSLISYSPKYILLGCLFLAEIITSTDPVEIAEYRPIIEAKIIDTQLYRVALDIGKTLNWQLACTNCYQWLMYFKNSMCDEVLGLTHNLLLLLQFSDLPFEYSAFDLVLTSIHQATLQLKVDNIQDAVIPTDIFLKNIKSSLNLCTYSDITADFQSYYGGRE